METVEINGRRYPRYLVGQSRGYCVYDARLKTFGRTLANKRAAVREAKRLNATPAS